MVLARDGEAGSKGLVLSGYKVVVTQEELSSRDLLDSTYMPS